MRRQTATSVEQSDRLHLLYSVRDSWYRMPAPLSAGDSSTCPQIRYQCVWAKPKKLVVDRVLPDFDRNPLRVSSVTTMTRPRAKRVRGIHSPPVSGLQHGKSRWLVQVMLRLALVETLEQGLSAEKGDPDENCSPVKEDRRP